MEEQWYNWFRTISDFIHLVIAKEAKPTAAIQANVGCVMIAIGSGRCPVSLTVIISASPFFIIPNS